VLQITKPTNKSSAVKAVPGKSGSNGMGLFDLPDSTTQVSGMGNDDIMNYIAANQSSNDDLDLFS